MPTWTDQDKIYINALYKVPGVGAQKLRLLLAHFSSPRAAWSADRADLLHSDIGEKVADAIAQKRLTLDPDAAWRDLACEEILLVTREEEFYPPLLREIPSPPEILYMKGQAPLMDRPFLAIVGSRRMTAYGKQACYRLSYDLARVGVTIVSGMALGIDAIAHRGALDAGETTIAIMGTSVDDAHIVPRANFTLSRAIIKSGTLISDYPLVTSASEGTFPARNRIMAGMVSGVIVVEAAEGSGSLITTTLALEYNRDVFAVPGSIFSPQSAGSNALIKSGAKMVTCAADIMEELHIEQRKRAQKTRAVIPATPEEEKILALLKSIPEPCHIDKITRHTKLETHVSSATLSLMEMKGLVKNMGGDHYVCI